MSNRHSIDVGSIDATLHAVRLPFGLVLHRVVVRGEHMRLSQNPFELSLKEPGEIEVEVYAEAVADFLNRKAPAALQDFSVDIGEGSLTVHATARILVPIRAAAVCTLEIVEGSRLFVRLQSVGKLGPAVQKIVQSQLDQINPVLDMKDLPITGRLDSVTLREGKILVSGTLTP